MSLKQQFTGSHISPVEAKPHSFKAKPLKCFFPLSILNTQED